MSCPPIRSPLRYPGGKSRIAHLIVPYLPPHEAYIEPYCGSGAILLAKEPAWTEILNDTSGQIVNVFRVLRDPVQSKELIRLVELTPFSREEFLLSYEPVEDPVEQARRTLVRSQMGFGPAAVNGKATGFRKQGRHKSRKQSDAADWASLPGQLGPAIRRLKQVAIEDKDAIALIQEADGWSGPEQILYYCDPPYVMSTRSLKHKYASKDLYENEMSDEEHIRLSMCLKRVKGMVVLSGYESPLYDKLYGGEGLPHSWKRYHFGTHGHRGGKRTEVIWLNDLAEQRLRQRQLPMDMG